MKRPLIVIGPLPPPVHGVTISTELVAGSPVLRQRFDLKHLDTSDHRPVSTLGRWDATNVYLGVRHTIRLLRLLRGRRGVVYLPISQGSGGFARDSLFIHCGKLCGWEVAAHLRGSGFREFHDSCGSLFRRWIRYTLRRLDSAAVMGASLRPVLTDFMPDDRIAVIPNGTPIIRQDGRQREQDCVLFLGNLLRRKGVVESVDAALLVLRRYPTARFLFVGSWESDELERMLRLRAAKAGERILFLRPVSGEAKTALLLSSTILLFPPIEPEGHPRAVLEGLAAGLPVITTNRGSIAETVIDGECGFVLEESLPELLAERIFTLLHDRDLLARMSTAARARHLAEYTQERSDRRLADWLTRVAARRTEGIRQEEAAR